MSAKEEAYQRYLSLKAKRRLSALSFEDWKKRHWGEGEERSPWADLEDPTEVNDMTLGLISWMSSESCPKCGCQLYWRKEKTSQGLYAIHVFCVGDPRYLNNPDWIRSCKRHKSWVSSTFKEEDVQRALTDFKTLVELEDTDED
jgi:hypothetical protein